MHTKQTVNEGLKRAYLITIPAADLTAKIDAEIKKVAPQVRMPGFRPGKVPANLVRKMHGEAIAQEALNTSIQDGIQALMAEQRLRPAMQPSVSLKEGYAPGKNAEVTVELEVLPDVPAPAIDGLKLERLTAEVAQCIWDHLKPHGVAVVVDAQHGCMTGRGVRTPGVGMITSRMMGTFLTDERSRKEVLSLMGY